MFGVFSCVTCLNVVIVICLLLTDVCLLLFAFVILIVLLIVWYLICLVFCFNWLDCLVILLWVCWFVRICVVFVLLVIVCWIARCSVYCIFLWCGLVWLFRWSICWVISYLMLADCLKFAGLWCWFALVRLRFIVFCYIVFMVVVLLGCLICLFICCLLWICVVADLVCL